MKFEYDPKKSITNKIKHSISLEEAKKLWDGLAVEVKAKTIDEERFMLIGKIKGHFYSCIYTLRGDAVRLISARRSRKAEEDIYHEYIKTQIY